MIGEKYEQWHKSLIHRSNQEKQNLYFCLMSKILLFFLFAFLLLHSCNSHDKNGNHGAANESKKHLVNEIPLYDHRGNIQAVIEIPAGTNEKWEVNKSSGQIERDSLNGAPRSINYLGYPANYGFVPQTLLSKDLGGDGDPLDAIILGSTKPRGTIVSSKVLGVLQLSDQGEQDDKLILVDVKSPMAAVNSLQELEENHPKILMIIRDWFLNYKGTGVMISHGYAEKSRAESILLNAHNQHVAGFKK